MCGKPAGTAAERAALSSGAAETAHPVAPKASQEAPQSYSLDSPLRSAPKHGPRENYFTHIHM